MWGRLPLVGVVIVAGWGGESEERTLGLSDARIRQLNRMYGLGIEGV
jgi:hypothetical protein